MPDDLRAPIGVAILFDADRSIFLAALRRFASDASVPAEIRSEEIKSTANAMRQIVELARSDA